MIGRYLNLSLILLILLISACSERNPPEPSSEEYRDAVSAFYLSLAAIESDQAVFAVEKMNQVAETFPEEPVVWANLGVFAMRQGNFELAAEHLEKAGSRMPENGKIHFLFGILESRQGNIEEAVDHLKKAAEQSPEDPRITYALASELERQDAATNADSIKSLLTDLNEKEPKNLAVLLEMTRIAAKLDDRELLEQSLKELDAASETWPAEVGTEFADLKQEILGKAVEDLTFEIAYLRNNLNKIPKFQADFNRIELPPNQVGFLMTEFHWLPEPDKNNAAPDEGVTFDSQPLEFEEGQQMVIGISLADDEIPELLSVKGGTASIMNGAEFRFPSNEENITAVHAVSTIDYNYDFLNDLIFVGSEGIRFYQQNEDSTFTEVTSELGLSPAVLNQSYSGAWKADIDLDGDLDVVLAGSGNQPVVLRNNGDNTFVRQDYFTEVINPIDFKWADLDADGDPDAIFLDEHGQLMVYKNERMGAFEQVQNLPEMDAGLDMEVADLNSDSYLEIVLLQNSAIQSLQFDREQELFQPKEVVSFGEASALDGKTSAAVLVNDFDNNGGADLLVTTPTASRLWLSDSKLEFSPLDLSLPGNLSSAVELTGDNRLDLVGLDNSGKPFQLINRGTKEYNGRIIRPRASGTMGDQRINSFGIGGEVEIRSGLLYHKQPITSPDIHFGLGTYEEAQMLRIVWPNGTAQAEFAELGYGSKIFNEQMLKGSCPWVFTYNGEEMEFVTDFLWRTALGLRINAQGTASAIHSIDWIKIDGDQLKPKDGYYDVRITADLWETHFFDHVSLMVVDHPKDTEVLVDERFVLPAPEQKLYPVSPLRPVKKAVDHDGKDVTHIIRNRDGKYADNFNLTAYQGVAEEHYLEIDLGEDISRDETLYLMANGWVYPTDSSINIAISQGKQDPPHGIFLQVPDGDGGWKTVRDDIGFPAGKNKTVLINLSDLSLDEIPAKIRLLTNMEIYWDQISMASGLPDSKLETTKLMPGSSELRYRGFSEVNRDNRFVPEVPDYQTIAGTTPKWIDLIGYYTRFGDVQELVQDIDDRYVIMNAGDELVFRFPAQQPPPEGWERDFVLVGDGWVKDGDYNTGFSKTVLPLPYHGMEDYSEKPGELVDDPVYQQHKQDWIQYHTRYITPGLFQSALRFENKATGQNAEQ